MPLVNSDFAALEWRTIVELAGDKIALEEINNGLDFHSDNQRRFGLPSRLIAKVFLFRWIYRGSAYAYSMDPDFNMVGGQDFWQRIIDEFNSKYVGIYAWHEAKIAEAQRTGLVTNHITGRQYTIKPKETRFGIKWPEPDIVNYPNQGFGNEIASMVRIEADRLVREAGFEELIVPILPVHDSMLDDCSYSRRAWKVCIDIREQAIRNLPRLASETWGVDLQVEQKLEHEVGVRYGWLHKIQ